MKHHTNWGKLNEVRNNFMRNKKIKSENFENKIIKSYEFDQEIITPKIFKINEIIDLINGHEYQKS